MPPCGEDMDFTIEIICDSAISMLVYIHAHLGISGPIQPPDIEIIASQQLEQIACPDGCSEIKGWTTPNNIVYLSADLDMNNSYDRSVIFHELVHHVQYRHKLSIERTDCLTWKAREAQAYQMQIEWLQKTKTPFNSLRVNQAMRNFHRIKCPEP